MTVKPQATKAQYSDEKLERWTLFWGGHHFQGGLQDGGI